MAKSKNIKSEKNWDRLYDAYLRQHERSAMNLRGNIEDTLTKVEYKSLYQNMVSSGITQNITRTIVQKEAKVSGRQARVRMEVAKNMLKKVKEKINMQEPLTVSEFEVYKMLLNEKLTLKEFRTNPELSLILNEYISEVNRMRELAGEDDSKISYAEFIDSP